jgi:hypothetical protein
MNVWDVFQGGLRGLGTICDEDSVGVWEVWGEIRMDWSSRKEVSDLTVGQVVGGWWGVVGVGSLGSGGRDRAYRGLV